MPSAFERPYWLSLEPPLFEAPRADIGKLRKLSYQLFIRLPRLISLVRSLRSQKAYHEDATQPTKTVAALA